MILNPKLNIYDDDIIIRDLSQVKVNNENEVTQTTVNNNGNNGNIGSPAEALNSFFRALIEPTIKDILNKNYKFK